jgi:fumarylpyruvate hydrolase
MNYAFPLAPPVTLDAMSSNPFPVRRIIGIAHNYPSPDGTIAKPAEPVFYVKPASAIVQNNSTLPYPTGVSKLLPEVVMAVALHKGGKNIPAERVDYDYVFGYAAALDMTDGEALRLAMENGLPWERAKCLNSSAPCSAITPEFYAGNIASGRIELKVNGEVRLGGNVADMLWKVPETVAWLSTVMELFPGDIIFTGTPAGTSPVAAGDVLEATVAGLEPLIITIG